MTGHGYILFDWMLTTMMVVAAVLQVALARMAHSDKLLATGHALQAGGWTLGCIWFLFRLGFESGDLLLPPVSLLWLFLLALGTFFVNIYKIYNDDILSSRGRIDGNVQ